MNKNENTITYAVARGNLEPLVLHTLNMQPQKAQEIIEVFRTKIGVKFSPGTVYTKLWQLEREGCVTQDKEKKKFRLTGDGMRRLKREVASLLLIWQFLKES